MKTTITLLIITFLLSTASEAAIWRVNNESNYSVPEQLYGENIGGSEAIPVFYQVEECLLFSSFMDGDTIHLEASNIDYDFVEITRPCTILGGGYFAVENAPISPNGYSTKLNGFEINSSNVTIMGVYNTSTSSTSLKGSNVVVERCRFTSGVVILTSLNPVHSGYYIRRNYFGGNGITLPFATSNGIPNNVFVQNNIFKGHVTGVNVTNPMTIDAFENNTIVNPSSTIYSLIIQTDSFRNNIIRGNGYSVQINNGDFTNVTNNLGTNFLQFPTNSNNINLPVIASDNSLFVGGNYPNSIDRDYPLQSESVLDYVGNDGTQVGAFGGAYPYSISGVGPIPYIYEISTNGISTPSEGLIINISAKSGN
ncbi:MAG: hypothetical protein R2809_02335 [Flavobacteriales bacterium]